MSEFDFHDVDPSATLLYDYFNGDNPKQELLDLLPDAKTWATYCAISELRTRGASRDTVVEIERVMGSVDIGISMQLVRGQSFLVHEARSVEANKPPRNKTVVSMSPYFLNFLSEAQRAIRMPTHEATQQFLHPDDLPNLIIASMAATFSMALFEGLLKNMGASSRDSQLFGAYMAYAHLAAYTADVLEEVDPQAIDKLVEQFEKRPSSHGTKDRRRIYEVYKEFDTHQEAITRCIELLNNQYRNSTIIRGRKFGKPAIIDYKYPASVIDLKGYRRTGRRG